MIGRSAMITQNQEWIVKKHVKCELWIPGDDIKLQVQYILLREQIHNMSRFMNGAKNYIGSMNSGDFFL